MTDINNFGDEKSETKIKDMIPENWRDITDPITSTKKWETEIEQKLEEEYKKFIIYPQKDEIFTALQLIPDPENVKVIILGQDPYINVGQAHGLSFSIKKNSKVPYPPTLQNIWVEIVNDVYEGDSKKTTISSNLEHWAEQGVLLLNTILTVRAKDSMSHSEIPWTMLTFHIISELSKRYKNLVFLLWGRPAQTCAYYIHNRKENDHLVLETSHPSPLSAYRGFFGSKHFSTTNKFLSAHNKLPIKW